MDHVTKLFRSKGVEGSNIWLEGNRLTEAGFQPGRQYLQLWYPDRLVLMLMNQNIFPDNDIQKTITRKVVSSGNSPIIRIEGARVLSTFGKNFPSVKCTFKPGRIVIVGHKEPSVSEKTDMTDSNIERMSYGETPPNAQEAV